MAETGETSSMDATIATTTTAIAPVNSRWPKSLRALSYRNYRLLWIGSLISNIGTWMQITAQSWVVFKLSNDNPAMLGMDAFVAGVPVLLTPVGGVVADHVDRKKLMAGLTILQMAVAGFLAIMLGIDKLRVWQIIVCSGISGTLGTFLMPTLFAFMPDMVERKDLPNAVALNALQFNVSRVIGPVAGGLVLHHMGAAWSFGLNALSFIAVLVSLGMIHQSAGNRPKAPGTAMDSLREAAGYLSKRRDIILMLTMVLMSGFWGSPLFSMLPALCKESLNRPDAADFAMLLSFFGLGAVVGAMLLAVRSHHTPTPWRGIPIIFCMGMVAIVMGLIHHFWLAQILIFIAGMCMVGIMARLSTAISASIPAHLRGRLSSLIFMAIGTGLPLGGLACGFMAKIYGVRAAFITFGIALVLAISILGWIKQTKKIVFEFDPMTGGLTGEKAAVKQAMVENEIRMDTHT